MDFNWLCFVKRKKDKLDWVEISNLKKINQEFIINYKDFVVWKEIFLNFNIQLSIPFIKNNIKFISDINPNEFTKILIQKIKNINPNQIDWLRISLLPITEDFIRNHLEFINFSLISENHLIDLSDKFYLEFKNKLNWNYILINNININPKILENNQSNINWDTISILKLSENFINKYFDKLNYNNLCQYQSLSEDFIEKNIKFINWNLISKHQYLSESFLNKYKEFIVWNEFSAKHSLSEQFLRKKINILNWDLVLKSIFITKFYFGI